MCDLLFQLEEKQMKEMYGQKWEKCKEEKRCKE
jgi:hypothetical protein